MSDSVRPHRRQPTRLPRPSDSPGNNTGVGCHFLLQCMKVKSESAVAQSCLTLHHPTDCSPSGCSVHRIFQARVLEWGAIASSESCHSASLMKTSQSLPPPSTTAPPPGWRGFCRPLLLWGIAPDLKARSSASDWQSLGHMP